MTRLGAFVAGSLLLLSVGTFAQDVKVDFDKTYAFSNVKTYSIRLVTKWGNDLMERRVLAEIDEAIAAKGWKHAPDAESDLQVVLHGATTEKRSANTFYSGMGGYGYYGWHGGGMGTATTVVNEYKVGTLVVDIFDTKSRSLVFRGTAEEEISDNPERNVRAVEKASDKLFKNFPPKPQK